MPRRIDLLTSRIARLSRGVHEVLPPSVRRALENGRDFAIRRRRILAGPIIVIVHLVVLAALAWAPERPPPPSLIFVDLSPRPGEGIVSAIAEAPTPPVKSLKDQGASSRSASTALAEPDKATTRSRPRTEPTKPVESPTEKGAEPPIASTASDPASEAAEPSRTEVLALVETLTGTDVETVAAPPPVVAVVSQNLLEDIRLRQQRSEAARAGGGCAIDAALRTGFTEDATVQAALAEVPDRDKSVSNALQLWDGEWTAMGSRPDVDPLASLRAMTIAVVKAAPAKCRNAEVIGPRFIIIPLKEGPAMIIVIGSGVWRWRDVAPSQTPAIFRWLGLNR